MSEQRHNPRECWCGIDHSRTSRCEKCGGPRPGEFITCSLEECPYATNPRDAALGHGDTLAHMAAILINAGATHASAIQAAVVLDRGGSINDAWEHIEIALHRDDPSGEILAAEITRARERVLAGAVA